MRRSIEALLRDATSRDERVAERLDLAGTHRSEMQIRSLLPPPAMV